MAIQGPIAGKIHINTFNTVYAIIFAKNSKIIRRIIIPEHDWHFFDGWRKYLTWIFPGLTRFVLSSNYGGGGFHRCDSNETMIFAPSGNNDEMPDWENHIFNATGVVPPDAKCAVVLNGKIVDFCNADPELDSPKIDGAKLVLLNNRSFDIGAFIPYEAA